MGHKFVNFAKKMVFFRTKDLTPVHHDNKQ